jgi:hypothetical protein
MLAWMSTGIVNKVFEALRAAVARFFPETGILIYGGSDR